MTEISAHAINRMCALSMLLSIVALFYSGLVGHFAPHPLHTDPAVQVAQFYQQHGPRILIFAFVGCISTTLMMPAFCALSVAILDMQPRNRILAILQVTAGTIATVGPFLSTMFLAAAVVRPDNSPEVLAVLTDLAIIFIELSTLPALLQGLSIAGAILSDRSAEPVLPRWYGWLSLVWGFLAQGGLFAIFYQTGPFSATGVIGIIVPIVSLVVWMAATAAVLFWMKHPQA